MSSTQAGKIYEHFEKFRPGSALELGFAHGVSTCYLAGALDEFGGEKVTSIDVGAALNRSPNIRELLDRCDLAPRVDVVVADTSYTWTLMEMLRSGDPRRFDFVYIDGAHNWDVDGFAFFLVDRLVRPGGWILFDDLDWSYRTSPSMADIDWVRKLPEIQQTTPQVRLIFEVLVRTHPGYDEFRDEDGWGWARKLA